MSEVIMEGGHEFALASSCDGCHSQIPTGWTVDRSHREVKELFPQTPDAVVWETSYYVPPSVPSTPLPSAIVLLAIPLALLAKKLCGSKHSCSAV